MATAASTGNLPLGSRRRRRTTGLKAGAAPAADGCRRSWIRRIESSPAAPLGCFLRFSLVRKMKRMVMFPRFRRWRNVRQCDGIGVERWFGVRMWEVIVDFDGGWIGACLKSYIKFTVATYERHPEIYTVINYDNKEQEVKTSVRSRKAVGQSDVEIRKASGSVVNEIGKGKNLADAGELSKIEQLIHEKNFSRDDVTRLMEILQSRTVVLEQERKHSDAYPVGKVDVAGTSSVKPRAVRETKPEESSRVALRNSDPLWQPSTRETIGSSPVEIAKAYMNSRTADRGFRSEHKDMILSTHKDELSAMPLLPPRSPTTSIGWPGAFIEENTGYHTPHRSTLRSFPATPYSRAFSSKSKSKLTPLRGESEKLPNNSSTPYRQAHTPIFGNLEPDMPEDRHGSARPIRRTQYKFLSQSPAKVSPLVRSFRQSPLQVKESSDYSGFLSKQASEPGTSNTFTFKPLVDKDCDFNLTPVHQHNSKLARQILEQISKPPSQKQKMEELKLTVSARKTSALSESDKQVSSLRFGGPFDKHEGKRIRFFEVPSSGNLNDAASTQTSFLDSTSVPCDDNIAVSTINSSANGLEQKNLNEATDNDAGNLASPAWSFGNQSKEQGVAPEPSASPVSGVLNMQRRSLHSAPKTNLPSLSVERTGGGSLVASDNNGFTFPPSNSSSLSELPTPTFLPPSMPSALQPSTNSLTPPTYTFGNKKYFPPLVFSFPSTSTSAQVNDTAVIKFRFGSDDERISFGSIEKDAICC
ncbi:hypothetical protein AKJ16_DCAP00266 [Drosera capensis]